MYGGLAPRTCYSVRVYAQGVALFHIHHCRLHPAATAADEGSEREIERERDEEKVERREQAGN
jgi:hypothetical protein